jgi:hypothetical protein
VSPQKSTIRGERVENTGRGWSERIVEAAPRTAVSWASRPSSAKKAAGSASAAADEATPTVRERAKTQSHTPAAAAVGAGMRAASAPAAVATPLPPRKRRNGENTWPMTAARASAASSTTGASGPAPMISRPAATGAKPLAASSRNARGKYRHPQTRPRLVAPTLPLPRVLISTPPRRKPRSRLQGIPPMAKAAAIAPAV